MDALAPQTVILGGGFTGLYAALRLQRAKTANSVLLIDQSDRFRFRPLLYDYFSQEMDEPQVMPRYKDLITSRSITFMQDGVEAVDLRQQQVCLRSGQSCSYSHLVIALGSVSGYFGIEGAKDYTLPFRDVRDAIALQQQVEECVFRASRIKSEAQRRFLLTFVIVGGGPTGVELAATLADVAPRAYEKLGGDVAEVRIVLLNRGSTILEGDINQALRQTITRILQRKAVQVDILTNATVTAVTADHVEYKQDEQIRSIAAPTKLWTAGTVTNPIVKHLSIAEDQRDRKGRLIVKPTLQLIDYPNVFAGGDCAVVDGYDLPPTAQVANQQGTTIAHNILALKRGDKLRSLNVTLKGSMIKMGTNQAATNLYNRIQVNGEIGHLMRQAVYMNTLPTPKRDLKLTWRWLKGELAPGRLLRRWSVAIATGLVAAVVTRLLLQTGINFEWAPFNVPPSVALLMNWNLDLNIWARLLAWLLDILYAVIGSFLLVALFRQRVNAVRGVGIALGLWLVLMLVISPLIGWGFFGAGASSSLDPDAALYLSSAGRYVLFTLILHGIYGVIIGWMNQRWVYWP